MTSLGVITIGQSPRSDMVPEMAAHWPGVRVIERGALDGWTAEQIASVEMRDGDEVLTSRLRDGSSAVFGRDLVLPLLAERIREVEDAGVDATLLVCTGEFPPFEHSRPLLLASPLFTGGVRALADGVIGAICPLPQQEQFSVAKFTPAPVLTAVANPYGGSPQSFEDAAIDLTARGASVIVLDCMGYSEQHRAQVRRRTTLPVIGARSLVARLVGAVVAP